MKKQTNYGMYDNNGKIVEAKALALQYRHYNGVLSRHI